MNLQLKQIRQKAGLSQDEMAIRLSGLMECEIKVSRYGTWERGDRMMNLEQAYYCAKALGCTLNDLVGMKTDNLSDAEANLVESYRATSPTWQRVIFEQASNAAKEHPKTEVASAARRSAYIKAAPLVRPETSGAYTVQSSRKKGCEVIVS